MSNSLRPTDSNPFVMPVLSPEQKPPEKFEPLFMGLGTDILKNLAEANASLNNSMAESALRKQAADENLRQKVDPLLQDCGITNSIKRDALQLRLQKIFDDSFTSSNFSKEDELVLNAKFTAEVFKAKLEETNISEIPQEVSSLLPKATQYYSELYKTLGKNNLLDLMIPLPSEVDSSQKSLFIDNFKSVLLSESFSRDRALKVATKCPAQLSLFLDSFEKLHSSLRSRYFAYLAILKKKEMI